MSQATTLKAGQIRHLLRVTDATSRHPARDCLVLLLGLTWFESFRNRTIKYKMLCIRLVLCDRK